MRWIAALEALRHPKPALPEIANIDVIAGSHYTDP